MRKNLWGINCILTASTLLVLSSCHSNKSDCLHAQSEEAELKVNDEAVSIVESETNPEAQQVESAIDVLDIQESLDEKQEMVVAPVVEQAESAIKVSEAQEATNEEQGTAAAPVLEDATAEAENEQIPSNEVVNLEAVTPVEIVPQHEAGDQ